MSLLIQKHVSLDPKLSQKIVFYDENDLGSLLSHGFDPIELESFPNYMKQQQTRTFCLPYRGYKGVFYILHIPEEGRFLNDPDIPLKDIKIDIHRQARAAHEVGHVLLEEARPYEFLSPNPLIECARDIERRFYAENYCDVFSALMLLQQFDKSADALIKDMADLRILGAVIDDTPRHLTHGVLDEVLKMSLVDAVRHLNLCQIADLALDITDRLKPNYEKARDAVFQWKEVLYNPCPDTFSKPDVLRFFSSIGNLISISRNHAENFTGQFGFHAGDLREAFLTSALLKAVMALKMKLVDPAHMDVVSQAVECHLSGRDIQPSRNEYPDFAAFMRSHQKQSGLKPFQAACAAADPYYTRDMAHTYLVRRALRNFSEGPYAPFNIR